MKYEKDTIGSMTKTELRQFVVNDILTDPGAFPKAPPHDPTMDLPNQHSDSQVPVWNDASQRWKASASPLSYIRVQGTLAGFIADLNYRTYNISGGSTVMEYDPDNHFALTGGGQLSVGPGNYLLGFYVNGPAGNYECGWTLVYNGAVIDYTISNSLNTGGLGVVQNMGVSASGMTNFFSTAGGTIQIGGFQNAAIQVAGMTALYLPS